MRRPGRYPLPREVVVRHQRARITAALAEQTAENGYRAVTVADIVSRAGVARNTFYENFSSKQDCFLAAYDRAADEVSRQIVDAVGSVEAWPARVNAGLAAFVRYVAAEPAPARAFIVEAFSGGAAAIERRECSIQASVSFLRNGRKLAPQGESLPPTLEETIVGGVLWIVHRRIVTGQVEEIERLRPELVEFALTPYVGADAAARAAAEAPTLPPLER